MAASVFQDRRLCEPLQSMVDQTDAGMARAGHGLMTSTGFQVNADEKLLEDIAVYCLSSTAGVNTTTAPKIDVDSPGAILPRITGNGDTAGEEVGLDQFESHRLFEPSHSDATKTLVAEPFHRWMVAIHW